MCNHIIARTPTGIVVAFDLPFIPRKGKSFLLTGLGTSILDRYFEVGAILRVVAKDGGYSDQIAIRLEEPKETSINH